MPDRDNLDRLIDSELARYAEPRAGLEQRILARVEADAELRPRNLGATQRWTFAGAVAAIALLAAFLVLPRITHRESKITLARVPAPDQRAVGREGSPEAPVEAGREIKTPRVDHVRSSSPRQKKATTTQVAAQSARERPAPSQRPKLDVFPAAEPLSQQERALVALATASTKAAREELVASQRELGMPIAISAIDIPPITKPDEGNN